MPFCPKCRDEFQDWVKTCPDCHVDLVDTLPAPAVQKATTVKRKIVTPSESLVTIATYYFPLEAHLYRSKLESEGIFAFVADEYITNINWMYSIAVGGVKLQVKESDASKALRVLEKPNLNIAFKTSDYPGYSDEDGCPRCHSIDIRYELFRIRPIFILWFIFFLLISGYSIFAASFTLPILKRKWKCNNCGYEWKAKKLQGKESEK